MFKVISLKNNKYVVHDELDNSDEYLDKAYFDILKALINIEIDINENLSVNNEDYKNKLYGEDAFNNIRNKEKGFRFLICDGARTAEVEFITFLRQGLTIGGVKDTIKVKTDNEIRDYSKDYFINTNLEIKY